jgi:hypothetical protein
MTDERETLDGELDDKTGNYAMSRAYATIAYNNKGSTLMALRYSTSLYYGFSPSTTVYLSGCNT